jgi:cobalt-zinc-cadmium efflux system protein
MEGVPKHINVNDVGKAMANVDLVRSVHDLHIWTLSSGVVVLTAHIEIDDFKTWNKILDQLREMLIEKFRIEHVTLQPEIFTYTLHHITIRDSSS